VRRNFNSPVLSSVSSHLVLAVSLLSLSHNCLAQAGKSSQPTKTSTAPTTANATATNSSKSQQDSVKASQEKSFSISGLLSRSRNLVDFKDGSRSDSLEVLVIPSFKTAIGKLSLRLAFAEDLNDSENTANGFADTIASYSLPPIKWVQPNFTTSLAFSLSGVAPTSKVSQKQTQLRGALSTAVAAGISGETRDYGSFSAGLSISAGRSFHAYEEDINGAVLAQYSSNQILTAGYSIAKFSFDFEFWNRSRWTYQNNVRQNFILSQELGYAVTPNFSVAIGHTNEGSALKANGQESNIELFDEDSSTIYGSLGVSY